MGTVKSIVHYASGFIQIGSMFASLYIGPKFQIVSIISGAICYYTRQTRINNNEVDNVYQQAILNVNHQMDKELPKASSPQQTLKNLKWKAISMNKKQFNKLKKLTLQKFLDQSTSLTCPFSGQIMKQPCQMKCCKDIQSKGDRWAERKYIEFQIEKNKKCILCQSVADYSYVEPDEFKEYTIYGFRARIAKTYQQLSVEQRQQWRPLIDDAFGVNYTKELLDNFKYS